MAGLPGLVVARGVAAEPTSGVAYGPLSDALAAALVATPDQRLSFVVGDAGHDLAALLPALMPRLDRLGISHAKPTLEAPEQLASRLTEGILGALERLATDGVVLLALEDLHWADPATRAFVMSLLRVSRPMRICLVATYQPEALHRRHPATDMARALAESQLVTAISLGPLARDEVAALIEQQLGEAPSSSLLAAVLEGSGGNPLVVEQLTLAASTLAGIRLSDPFDQVLSARLDALSADAARAVRLLAAARCPIRTDDLLAIRLPEGRVAARALPEAEESGLVALSEDRIRIAHELYAEAVEELELAPERHAMHAALAARDQARPEVAAWHWSRAGRPDEARRAHLRAAAATERLDPGETALLHYQSAMEIEDEDLTEGPGGVATSAVLLAAAARAAAAAGAFRRAAAFMRRAIDQRVVRRPGAPSAPRDAQMRTDLAELHLDLGRYRWSGGDLVGGMEALEHALTLMPIEPTRARAHALATLAQHLMIDGRFAESAKLAQEARAVAREAHGAAEELGHATCTLGVDVAYQGELDRGLALLEEATEIARSEGRLDDLMRAYANRTTLLDLDSRREQALAVVKEGLRDARSGGLSRNWKPAATWIYSSAHRNAVTRIGTPSFTRSREFSSPLTSCFGSSPEISRWPRGFLISSGAACRTRRCSISPAMENCVNPRRSMNKSYACSRTPKPWNSANDSSNSGSARASLAAISSPTPSCSKNITTPKCRRQSAMSRSCSSRRSWPEICLCST